jgi:DNA-binding transcriptional LysR family regulator
VTLEQLRIFVAVAERQHMTHAARDINITQSAASAAIAALEARYAIKLFDRIGRRIELTETGRTFLGEARAVLARTAAAERALADLAGLKRGSLSLYASQTIANYWLPRYITQFHEQFPDIKLKLATGNTEQVAAATREGLADIGFVEGAVDDPHLSVRKIEGDRLVIVVDKRHPFAKKPKLKPADLKTTPWVLREAGSGTRTEFEAALKHFGLAISDLTVVLELPSNEAVRAAVEAGAGATATSELVAAPALLSGAIVSPEFPLRRRPFLVLHHKERYVSRAETALLNLIGVPAGRDRTRKP